MQGEGYSINNEVKKRGFMFDKNRPIEVRVDDIVVVYISKFIERLDEEFDCDSDSEAPTS